MVDNLGICSPEFRFDLLSSLFPFRPLLLGFGEDPGDTLLGVLAFDPRGGLLKSGTCACHVYQTINLGPATVRGLAVDCLISGEYVIAHGFATRDESRGGWTRKRSEVSRDGGEGEVQV